MKFVQVIEFVTDREEELQALEDQWRARTDGQRTTVRAVYGRDRARPNHYVAIVEFPSYEDAQRNSELPQTDEMARKMSELCAEPPRYVDLDVLREDKD